MSEHESHDDEILEQNLGRLLEHAQRRPEVPAEARARMLAELRDARGEAPKSSPAAANDGGGRRRWSLVGVAVALVAAAILAWVLGLGQRLIGSSEQEPELARWDHRELGAKAITLADGTRALLRSGTSLEQIGPRHLRLVAGEVLLDVAEAVEPMLVDTPQGRALVLGTRLLLRSDEAQTLAAVLHGSAKVESDGVASQVLLRAGEQALLHDAGAPERIAGRRLSHEIDWARELLAPERTPEPIRRGNLLARVPRWTGQLGPSPEWPLPIRELTVDVHVEGGHVRATIDQTFFNHLDRNLEGVYKFPLPPDAAISRLAMYVDGVRMEAGVVERDRGRDIYEQIVHRRRDPALLEWMQGNLFQVRIFPLPARSEKRILLSYTAALDELYGEGELRVPIPEIDLPVAKVNYRIRVVGAAGREFSSSSHEFAITREGEDLLAEFSAKDHAIGADIVAALSGGAAEVEHHRMLDAQGHRHHGVRVRPQLEGLDANATEQPARDWIVVFDSSASRGAAELEAQRQFLHEFAASLDPSDRLAVQVFDSRVRWSNAELRAVGQLDLAALDEFVARESRVGLGMTDLGLAIDEALARFEAATPPSGDGRERAPTLLYLGDGLGQELQGAVDHRVYVDDLAQRFAGRAAFVGVSFGQAYDEPALSELAAAGEGLHLHVAEGDAVAWRALELLTTLATPRVLDLEASFVDREGRTIAAETTHASARMLAGGEALELLARLEPDAPEPVAVELRGKTKAGEWSHRVELPEPTDDAGWLPRAWARAHVAALTDDGVEQHASEITELGLAHFLVTPTTSLLVLESEAMYRNFDVHRPSEDGWARYPAPDRIEVVREQPRSEAGRGQYVTRRPLAVLATHSSWGGNIRTRGVGPLIGSSIGESIGVGGLGLIGTGRGGGGSGGFGIGLGSSGLIGKGGSGTGSGYGSGSGAGFGHRGLRRDVADEDARSAGPQRGEFRGFVSREPSQTTWASNRQQAAVAQPAGGALASVDVPFASTIVSGASLHAEVLDSLWPGSMPWPQALHVASDWRLNDLGELVPALFEEPFDLAREELLLTGLDGERGSISDAAAELLARARAAQADVRFELPEGGTLGIDAAGRFALTHQRWGFLTERIVYDGEALHADYPQLELSVVRAVGPTSPALLGEWVPWMVPDPDHLARFYDVVQTGPRTLKLTTLANDEEPGVRAWLEVELDAEYRVIALRVHVGEQLLSTTRFSWTDAGLVLDGGRTLTRVGQSQAIAPQPQATRVSLPLPSPADLALELDELELGSPEWIALQQQRLAGSVALGQTQDAATILAELADKAGRVLPGELVLGGAALARAPSSTRDAVLDAATEGPVRDLLVAGLQASAGKVTAIRKLADDSALEGTPVGFWASYRTLLHESQRTRKLARLERFLQRYHHPTFAFVATWRQANQWWRRSDPAAEAWLALAAQDNHFEYIAMHQAGLAQYRQGRYEDAAAVFEQSFAEAEADGALPIVDWSVQWSISNAGGEAAWQLLWSGLRDRIAKAEDPRLAIRFMLMAQQLGRPEDGQRVLDRLEPERMDPQVGVAVFDVLLANGHISEAKAVLASLRERDSDSPAILLRTAALAEQQGDLDDAAASLERALAQILDEQGVTLGELRRGFEHLFDLRARAARPLATTEQTAEAALEAALAVADRWRLEDPDNPRIDQRCAELLWSLDRDEEAWRHLSSTLDRHATEGEALAWLADTLERSGRLDRAQQVWDRAIAVEPTDVHNRVRRASNLIANGERAEAKVALQEVVDGDWQPRFRWDVDRARKLLKSL